MFDNSNLDTITQKLKINYKSGLKFTGEVFENIIITSLHLFLLIFIILLIPILIKGDYESILKVAEFAIIGSGTLAILTFTYAIAREGSKKYEIIVNSGELLFKSTIYFIIGLGLIPGVGYMLNHPNSNYIKDFLNTFNTPFAEIYDWISGFVTVCILIIGMISLMLSVYFFMSGLKKLVKSTHNE